MDKAIRDALDKIYRQLYEMGKPDHSYTTWLEWRVKQSRPELFEDEE